MRLTAKLVDVVELTPLQREHMFTLMVEHYANVQRHVFEADLAEKRWVILVRDPSTNRLCGFSSQTLLDAPVGGRPVRVLFSGDTIIHRKCWGDPALSHVWGQFALALIDAHRGEELYWFLISQGYKTYRFLTVFFHEFYPRHDTSTPDWARGIVDALARGRYPKEYDAAAGVIRASAMQYQLRTGLADVTPERLRDVHVRFFHARNPGHVHGDELCCLAPLTRENFTRAAYRVIGPDKPGRPAFEPDCPARKPDLPLGVS
jgi:hypothetical protein